jgi:hypothetical protein
MVARSGARPAEPQYRTRFPRHPLARTHLKFFAVAILALLFLCMATAFIRSSKIQQASQINSEELALRLADQSSKRDQKTPAKDSRQSLQYDATSKELVANTSLAAARLSLQIGNVISTQMEPNNAVGAATQLSVTFKGPYAAHKQWLSDMLANYPTLGLQHLTLSQADLSTGQVAMSAKLVLFSP